MNESTEHPTTCELQQVSERRIILRLNEGRRRDALGVVVLGDHVFVECILTQNGIQ